MAKERDRIVMIGLDGGTWTLLDPLLDEGHMPNLAALRDRGSHGVLKSTIPPVTAPAWATFMTGKNPGKHGILHFFKLAANFEDTQLSIYDEEIVNYAAIKEPTLFQVLKGSGKRVGSINLPMTYPPEDLDGFLVSCWLTPPGAKRFTTPPELAEQLGDYRIDQYFGEDKYALAPPGAEFECEAFFADIMDVLEKRAAATLKMMNEQEWDLFMMVFTETDRVQHAYWRALDPQGEISPEVARERELCLAFYRRLDQHIGALVDAAGPEATLFMASDHGFGPPPSRRASLNFWLRSQGWLNLKDLGPMDALARAIVFSPSIRPLVPKGLLNRLRRFVSGGAGRMENAHRVDWKQSRAWSINLNNYHGGIFLAPGIQGEARDALRAEIAAGLETLTDPATGERLVDRVMTREDVFQGPCAVGFPDLVVRLKRNYEAGPEGGFDVLRKELVPAEVPHPDGRGDHTQEGMYVVAGKLARDAVGEGPEFDLQDMMPTFLYLLDQALPSDLDGKVMSAALDHGLTASRPVRTTDETDFAPRSTAEPEASDEEAEAIRRKLQELGYM